MCIKRYYSFVTFTFIINAGILRGETGMKTPDALHVATAINQQCDIFLTNDARVHTPHNMQCVLLSDFADGL
jgi:predicted nucleic acid-binding protein